MAFHDAVLKHNVLPAHRHPATTPYKDWSGKKFDIITNPLLSFGTVIMAHLPVADQTALSGKAFLSYYVGTAPNYRGGILLYNPASQRTIIRRTYEVIGDKAHNHCNLM